MTDLSNVQIMIKIQTLRSVFLWWTQHSKLVDSQPSHQGFCIPFRVLSSLQQSEVLISNTLVMFLHFVPTQLLVCFSVKSHCHWQVQNSKTCLNVVPAMGSIIRYSKITTQNLRLHSTTFTPISKDISNLINQCHIFLKECQP